MALLSVIEKWKTVLDNKGFGGAVLMNLSKAIDTINHDLLIAKFHAHGSDKRVSNYNRWHRAKINQNFSSLKELLQGVLQGSLVGSLLFKYIFK